MSSAVRLSDAGAAVSAAALGRHVCAAPACSTILPREQAMCAIHLAALSVEARAALLAAQRLWAAGRLARAGWHAALGAAAAALLSPGQGLGADTRWYVDAPLRLVLAALVDAGAAPPRLPAATPLPPLLALPCRVYRDGSAWVECPAAPSGVLDLAGWGELWPPGDGAAWERFTAALGGAREPR